MDRLCFLSGPSLDTKLFVVRQHVWVIHHFPQCILGSSETNKEGWNEVRPVATSRHWESLLNCYQTFCKVRVCGRARGRERTAPRERWSLTANGHTATFHCEIFTITCECFSAKLIAVRHVFYIVLRKVLSPFFNYFCDRKYVFGAFFSVIFLLLSVFFLTDFIPTLIARETCILDLFQRAKGLTWPSDCSRD